MGKYPLAVNLLCSLSFESELELGEQLRAGILVLFELGSHILSGTLLRSDRRKVALLLCGERASARGNGLVVARGSGQRWMYISGQT